MTIVSMLACARMNYAVKQEGYDSLKKPLIRVRVLHTADKVKVGAKGDCVVRTWDENNEKSAYYSSAHLRVAAEGRYLSLFDLDGNRLETKLTKVTVIADKKSWLWLDKRKFRGVFEFYSDGHDTMYVVNVLNLEDYLRGVLAPEIGRRTEQEYEAVKAQAVAARTYALVTRGKYPNKQYDLVNEILDQVYTGVDGEQRLTDRALKDTRGEVLTFDGQLIETYYHSTCGGHTDALSDVWDKSGREYLQSVEDDTFCNWSKYYTWSETLVADSVLASIRKYLVSGRKETDLLGNKLMAMTIQSRAPGGRIITLRVTTEKGDIYLTKDQIRWAIMRPNSGGILRSADVEFSLGRNSAGDVDSVYVTGKGYGHGIGMCQCGAIGRARVGQTYKDILLHYYRGAAIQKMY
jgi:stage II sporulation protein D